MIIKETIVWSLNNFAWFSSVVFLEIFVEESPRFNDTKLLWLLKKQLCLCVWVMFLSTIDNVYIQLDLRYWVSEKQYCECIDISDDLLFIIEKYNTSFTLKQHLFWLINGSNITILNSFSFFHLSYFHHS